jgi:hypothetical protein
MDLELTGTTAIATSSASFRAQPRLSDIIVQGSNRVRRRFTQSRDQGNDARH